jgi:V/A-type H+/Na+-transporting ATPase subunit A
MRTSVSHPFEAGAGDACITRISGALVEGTGLADASLYEIVRIGESGLMGEIVRLHGELATVQVYEETNGLRIGEPIHRTGRPLEAILGPGLIGSIFDGIGRPLDRLAAASGAFIRPGVTTPSLDTARRWTFEPDVSVGDRVEGGDCLGKVQETADLRHWILVPPGLSGVIDTIAAGDFTIDDPIGTLDDGSLLHLAHAWPARNARPARQRLPDDRPFVTGQRVLDLLFPVAEGGSVAMPGGFGTGKTIVEQSLAKHGIADVIVYIGCGERGNEMAEVLHEFPRLIDPKTGRSIMDRTVLIANTSNMPVAAREASIYLGITIGEYYRDMGLRVAVLADSISRWAEALREIGSRLQEMPGEEGYPTHLGSRLGRVYERAGRTVAAGRPERAGALTLISAVSPPGGDLSEPVTQASLRVAGALWALDASLAHRRHFPAIDWDSSFSLYVDATAAWFRQNAGESWTRVRSRAIELLREERELTEIAALIGVDAMQDRERFVLAAARMFRDVVLAQSAFDENDRASSPRRTHSLASLAISFADEGLGRIARGSAFDSIPFADIRAALMAVRLSPEASLDAAIRNATTTIAGDAHSAAAPQGAP